MMQLQKETYVLRTTRSLCHKKKYQASFDQEIATIQHVGHGFSGPGWARH